MPEYQHDTETELSRRRPGRRDDVHPSLIPLLRGQVPLDPLDPLVPEDLEAVVDSLAPARGIMLAIVLSIPIWGLMIGGIYGLLH
jgi:hypothetical protein